MEDMYTDFPSLKKLEVAHLPYDQMEVVRPFRILALYAISDYYEGPSGGEVLQETRNCIAHLADAAESALNAWNFSKNAHYD